MNNKISLNQQRHGCFKESSKDIFSPQISDILSRLGVCNNRGKLSYRDDELVSF
jgi:hypothetical protein